MTPEPSLCPDDEALSQFADGALAFGLSEALGQHTESCESCRRTVAALVRLRSSRGTPDESLPAHRTARLAPGTELGRYVIRRFIGAGAMGAVFEADDPTLRRRVAVKVLRGSASSASQQRLHAEAQAMARLSHRNVATVFDVGAVDGQSWVAMELIEGTTLRAWWRSQARPPPVVLSRLIEAGRGLAAAHAAGLVHRDFKPDNVLVENDGRVVVTDFGLAAAEADARAESLVGTPAYMPLEQLTGTADARSDQFSFCVTCVEALTHRRPFEVASSEALKPRLESNVPDPTVMALLPSRARRVLSRGLRADAAERWPSMEALLLALTPPRRERWLLGAALAVATLVLLGLAGSAWEKAHRCDGAEAKLLGVWDDGIKAKVSGAFAATGVSFASVAANRLVADLDRWASAWASQWREACEAAVVRHEQSGELMDLRRACLRERLDEVSALKDVLTRADARTVEAASTISQSLSPLDSCAQETALRAPVKLPTAPAMVARVAAARLELAQRLAERSAGQNDKARESMARLEAEAKDIGYRPLEAEVLLLSAHLAENNDDFDGASALLHRALVAAQAGGHSMAAAQAWAYLVRIEGVQRAHLVEGEQAAELASAASERLDKPDTLQIALGRHHADLLSEKGLHEEAKTELQLALAAQKRSDPESIAIAAILNRIGVEERRLKHLPEALALHQEALAMLVKQLGPEHPDVAAPLKNIGSVSLARGELDDAVRWYEKALALELAAYGPLSLKVADTQTNISAVRIRQGELAAAEKGLRSVISIIETKRGADHPSLFGDLNNLAVVLRYTERPEEAEAALRRALRITEKTHGPVHESVATTLINLGDVQLSRRDFDGSVASYERAIAVTEKTSGLHDADLADCWGGLAFPLLQQQKWARALEATEKALAIYAESPGEPLAEGMVHFAHAEALIEVAPNKAKVALAEAAKARASLVNAGAQPGDFKEMDAWLSRHSRPR